MSLQTRYGANPRYFPTNRRAWRFLVKSNGKTFLGLPVRFGMKRGVFLGFALAPVAPSTPGTIILPPALGLAATTPADSAEPPAEAGARAASVGGKTMETEPSPSAPKTRRKRRAR